jgi:hypothetical protein
MKGRQRRQSRKTGRSEQVCREAWQSREASRRADRAGKVAVLAGRARESRQAGRKA